MASPQMVPEYLTRRSPMTEPAIQLQYRDGRASVYRFVNEPGLWRFLANDAEVPLEDLDLYLEEVTHQLEVKERVRAADAEKVKKLIAEQTARGPIEVVETCGSWALIKSKAGWQVTSGGFDMLPSPSD